MVNIQGYPLLILLMGVLTIAVAVQKNDERSDESVKLGGHALRSKRNLLQFKSMIECKTNKSWQDFNWYGCYCGYGGKGSPVDELDRCCYVHDNCYAEINKRNLCSWPWDVYTAQYKWYGCEMDTVAECAKASDYEDPDEGRCDSAICECDLAAAECFANSHWDKKYDDWPQSKC